ncbi:S phase cyclin A-associated protein in the endoplasmic reticulum [Heracleum sosnowskyi]|uniref:S phase cyclin A-associated protein in the endoplasmic reticulum n=1 Tax=Heracleum sosnowskyi TaxID=360622 RepID=A0AAD8MIN1_9APIA|nr:S phase cyclin A-associated protein in the endoplasmic reticulum [Heracleum sosnowskyi]
MMEENGENGDDQGSGWLQVKKKHRSSSKFSLHGWVGGLSGRPAPKALQSQPPTNKRRSSINSGSQDIKAKGGSVVHDASTVVDHSPVLNKDITLDKGIVSNKCPTSVVKTVEGLSYDGRTGDDQKFSGKDNIVVIQKIKWGDLDDEVLILDSGSISGAQIKFGGFENDNLVCRKAETGDVSGTCMNASSKPGKSTLGTVRCEEDHMPEPLLSPQTKSFTEELKEGNEVASGEVNTHVTNDQIPSPGSDVSGSGEENSLHANSEPLNSSCPNDESSTINVEAGLFTEAFASDVRCEIGDAVLPEVAMDESLSTVVDIVDSASGLPEKSGERSPRQSTTPESNEDCVIQETQSVLDGFSEVPTFTGEDEAVESKERFRQRLWCFLFENLNRSIDELYLLCELECDLEQMKEAVLVLEEAAFDFKELKSRVEEFETVKKASPQLIDGAPLTLKSDQRRPHALSWEVRRMTTSPHRAEILSSSLEAFRKIQQERAKMHASNDAGRHGFDHSNTHHKTINILEKHTCGSDTISDCKASAEKPRKQSGVIVLTQGSLSRERRNVELSRCNKMKSLPNGRTSVQNQSASELDASKLTLKDCSAVTVIGKSKRELIGPTSEVEKFILRKDRLSTDTIAERHSRYMDNLKRQIPLSEKDKEKKVGSSVDLWKSMDAWKEKRNWEDILATPSRFSSRFSYSPGMARKSAERARNLRDKLMSPEKKKRTSVDLKKEAEEKHARAMRIRGELETERVQKLQRTSEKLNRVNEWQAVRSMKLREGMFARHQRGESRHEAFLAKVVRRAGDESSKVNEVRFITSLNDENKKIILREKLQDSELRRAEKLQVMKIKQKEDMAREEAVLERKKVIEAEKSQRLAETQRKKEEALVRREEERKASSAAREAKALEQMRRKEIRAKAQQEEAELLAQKLAERLRESEQRRKFYLEQIRERASMDFRDQLSPFRRSLHKEGQSRSAPNNNGEVDMTNNTSSNMEAVLPTGSTALQNSLKKRIKKIRQKLMALKHEFLDPSVGPENSGIAYRVAVGTARAKIGRWLQELQRLRQARKEGASSIGLITAEMIKFLEGKDPELQASRQAGLLDFLASALPASHTSKPEACQVTVYLLRLLRVVLSLPANRSYFLAQNLLPPITPLLAGALENYIKIAASSNIPSSTNLPLSRTLIENLESITEVLDGFLWIVTVIIGHVSNDERQLQMQNGLLELVIAYQVVHRLRDLFALYDRPQVEGSPFPSSILLSINLLVTLTSRFRTVSSIDWNYSPSDTIPRIDIEEEKPSEVAVLGSTSLYNCNQDHELPVSVADDALSVSLPEVPEDKPLEESRSSSISEKAIDRNTDKVQSNNVKLDSPEAPKACQNLKDDKVKSSVSRKDEKSSVCSGTVEIKEEKSGLKQPVAFLLSAISDTGLVCLPSLLTAVLLQANNRLSSDQGSHVLPSNFEYAATGVLKVLNNLALIDVNFIQMMLARADLKMEFFHLMSFLLSHCTSKWGVANDKIGLLLFESLLLLSYFALFHYENQAVLRWGKSPTILHKVCDLPFVFFSDPELMPILAGTLVAACFGCDQNKDVVQQELSTDMLLSLLRSCKSGVPAFCPRLALESRPMDEVIDSIQLGPESRKLQGDISQRSNRYNSRSNRAPAKGWGPGNSARSLKMRNTRDFKPSKSYEEKGSKHNQSTPENPCNLMLHSRFPESFIDKAEQFFSTDVTTSLSEQT